MIAPTVWAASSWLADDGQGGENTKSGPIGLVVIIVLCVACYFLFKSMSKHLKKVREHPPTEIAATAAPAPPAVVVPPVEPSAED